MKIRFYTEKGFCKHYGTGEFPYKPLKKTIFLEMLEKNLLETKNDKYKASLEGLDFLLKRFPISPPSKAIEELSEYYTEKVKILKVERPDVFEDLRKTFTNEKLDEIKLKTLKGDIKF